MTKDEWKFFDTVLMEKDTQSGNLYDRIFKENAESLFIPIIEQHLGKKILSYKILPEKLPKTLEREIDFLYLIQTEEGEELLHIEFQTKGERDLVYRVGEYHGIILRKYRLSLRHVVIYLGSGKTRMPTHLPESQQYKGFDLINLRELDTEKLLSSQVPEVVLLALLGNYPTTEAESVLRLLTRRLKVLSGDTPKLTKYLEQLKILSRLRKLETLTKKIVNDMPINYDIKTDGLYLEGHAQGHEQGIEQGIEAIRCLNQGKSYEETAEITGLTIEKVAEIDRKRKN